MGSQDYATSENKGKIAAGLQEKGMEVHKYVLNMIHSCFIKISHVTRFSFDILFLTIYLICI